MGTSMESRILKLKKEAMKEALDAWMRDQAETGGAVAAARAVS